MKHHLSEYPERISGRELAIFKTWLKGLNDRWRARRLQIFAAAKAAGRPIKTYNYTKGY